MDKSWVLKALEKMNELLITERVAIRNLDIQRLAAIQKEKTALVGILNENTVPLNQECIALANKISKNNKRNSWLLRYGLKMVDKLQEKNYTKRVLTYNPYGHSLNVDGSPKVVSQRM